VKYGLDPQENAMKAGALPEGEAWGEEPQSQWGTLYLQGSAAQKVKTEAGDYRKFYANVRDVIAGTTAPAVTPEQAWQTMRIMELAQRSSREGRTLPWNPPA
jgi:scyllo-inositol 2-dehydrogenase (NADP+)